MDETLAVIWARAHSIARTRDITEESDIIKEAAMLLKGKAAVKPTFMRVKKKKEIVRREKYKQFVAYRAVGITIAVEQQRNEYELSAHSMRFFVCFISCIACIIFQQAYKYEPRCTTKARLRHA